MIFALLFTLHALAGPLETLSEISAAVWHPGSCSTQYNEADAMAAVGAAQCKMNGSLHEQATALSGLASDGFFALLGEQHARELGCAADFASKVASGDKATEDSLVQRLKAMRVAKIRLNAATARISRSMQACPQTMDELLESPSLPEMRDAHWNNCREVLINRTAYQALQNSLPMGNAPALVRFGDLYAGAEEDLTDAQLRARVRLAYGVVKSEVEAQAKRLRDIIKAQGGAGLNRDYRHDLLQDPAVINKVIAAGGDSQAMKGLACQADAQYGKGADALDNTLFVGGLVLGGAGGLAFKAGSAALKVTQAATLGRAAGHLTVVAARAMFYSAVVVEGVSAIDGINAACFAERPPMTAQCVSAPTVAQVAKDDCMIAGIMHGIGFVFPFAVAGATKMLARGTKYNGLSIPTTRNTANFEAYDDVQWKFGEHNGATEMYDPRLRARSTVANIQYLELPADGKVPQPYIQIDMVRGDPDRPGLGQYMIERVIKENPGKPVYSQLARENGARFKILMRDLAADPNLTKEQMTEALSNIPALRSVPGNVKLQPIYENGELVEMGIVRTPDFSKSSVTITNLDEVLADPQFRTWMASLDERPDKYFSATPLFHK